MAKMLNTGTLFGLQNTVGAYHILFCVFAHKKTVHKEVRYQLYRSPIIASYVCSEITVQEADLKPFVDI
jgi:hypothetical protein